MKRTCVFVLTIICGILSISYEANSAPTVASNLDVEVYVNLNFQPGTISTDAQDNIYVGNFSVSTGRIIKVSATTKQATNFGGSIPDPDAVIVDRTGTIGSAGSILVGGVTSGGGRITSISSGGSTTSILYQGGCLGNIQSFAFDSTGRLFTANFNKGTVCVIESGIVSQFIGPVGNNISTISTDPDNNVYISWGGTTKKYDALGALVDANFAVGNPFAFGPVGPFYGLLISRGGSIFAIDPNTKQETFIISGVFVRGITFNSAGDLLIADLSGQDKILRVFSRATGPLPVVSECLEIEEYAIFNSGRPGAISFDAQDNLFVGNFNIPGADAEAVKIFKVSSIDQSVSLFGSAISDPDAVIVDLNGTVGTSGSILVGSSPGKITQISSDGLSTSTLFQGGCLGNIQDWKFGTDGRLYIPNHVSSSGAGNVCVISNGTVSELIPAVGENLTSIAVDPSNNVYLSWNGFIRKYNSSGTILDSTFSTGTAVGYGPAGIFEGLIVNRIGSTLVINTITKEERFIAIGATGYVAFNSLGEMFVSQIGRRRVLRISLDPLACALCCISGVGSVSGSIIADCPSDGTGLLGVEVDAYEVGTGDLVGNTVTDEFGNYQIDSLVSGDYTITVVTPLGYTTSVDEIGVTVTAGGIATANFSLSCVEITTNPRAGGFWKHQVGVATGGRGNAKIDAATLCSYLDMIAAHFNTNEINQVIVYVPPLSGVCADKLQAAKELLNLKGNVSMTSRAKQQLTALLLNVAAGYISQTEIISADGATVTQAITYCDNLIDDPSGDHEKSKTICDDINNNIQVGAGVIPLSTVNIAYRNAIRPDEYALLQNYPNPFNPATEISFHLPEAGEVIIEVFNIRGQQVTTLIDAKLESGFHSVSFDGSTVASGIYFYRLTSGEFIETKKMLLLK